MLKYYKDITKKELNTCKHYCEKRDCGNCKYNVKNVFCPVQGIADDELIWVPDKLGPFGWFLIAVALILLITVSVTVFI